MWCMCLGVYLLRFITLGTKINKKYRNFSVLITEQVHISVSDTTVTALLATGIICKFQIFVPVQAGYPLVIESP